MKNTTTAKFLMILIVSATITVAIPWKSYAFTQANLITDLNLSSVVLVYCTIDYSCTIAVPWTSGVEWYAVSGYIGILGSGFFINTDGYLATNGHVVGCLIDKNYQQDIYTKKDIIQSAVLEFISSYEEQYGPTFSQEDIQTIMSYNVPPDGVGIIDSSFRLVRIILGEAQGNFIDAKRGIAATVVNTDPFLGRDLAILKVDIANTPSLLIGDSEQAKVGDTIYAFGYPATVAFHPVLGDTTYMVPSVTQGVVSAHRLTLLDVSAIQHSAATTGGNSGGPLLNDKGEVIGVNNMGTIDEYGLEVAGFNFGVASNVLKNFLQENGVVNSQGTTWKSCQQGLAYYYSEMYASAKSEFDAAVSLFPYYWRAQQLSQECQIAILQGKKATSAIEIDVSPSTVDANTGTISVNGSLSHTSEMPIPINLTWSAAAIKIEYTLSNKTVTHSVTCSNDGTFTDIYIPDTSGSWSVKASWQGDSDHNSAISSAQTFAVNQPSMFSTLTLIIIAVIVIGAGVSLLYIFKRKKATSKITPPEAIDRSIDPVISQKGIFSRGKGHL